MKRFAFCMLLMAMGAVTAWAQGKAEIKFDETTHNFGNVPKDNPVVTCTINFTNTGDAPLVIHQATATCGCTVPEYTQEPVMPGKTGSIQITFNGKNQYPGHFKKTIKVFTNTDEATSYLVIEGDLIDSKAKK